MMKRILVSIISVFVSGYALAVDPLAPAVGVVETNANSLVDASRVGCFILIGGGVVVSIYMISQNNARSGIMTFLTTSIIGGLVLAILS